MKYWIAAILGLSSSLSTMELPQEMLKIMQQPKYEHSIWGIYAQDLDSGNVLYDLNSNKFFSPASTTKLFSVAALLHTFGADYRFKTPVYAAGTLKNGLLKGNLVLVAQGDFVMGGRAEGQDGIAFTKMDHIIANVAPGIILTEGDPLQGLNILAKQVAAKGIKEVSGDVIIDDSLFETINKRDMILTPILINENLIDIVLNPTQDGKDAKLVWRPKVPGYTVDNQVKTVPKSEELKIDISSDDSGKKITVKGTIPADQTNIVRTFSIKDPKAFAKDAFIAALKDNGVKVNQESEDGSYKGSEPIATLISPPLSEYAKLILKVSHNLGADMIPLLLATHEGKKTYDEGMKLLGDFIIKQVRISPDAFVLADAAGGNENRLTPKSEIQLLDYVRKQKYYQKFKEALPILGFDGSLEDFAKKTKSAGKVFAKPGSGVSYNLATNQFFLITQGYAGYIEGKNGHLYGYMVIVNNAKLPVITDINAMFEDDGQLSSIIYEHTE